MNLLKWATQGVLLLNTVLTVQANKAFSHRKKGWEEFTDAIIKNIDQELSAVFLLWGKPAEKKSALIKNNKERVVCCSHPSPLSATRGRVPFIGSDCFLKVNQLLQEQGKSEIEWV